MTPKEALEHIKDRMLLVRKEPEDAYALGVLQGYIERDDFCTEDALASICGALGMSEPSWYGAYENAIKLRLQLNDLRNAPHLAGLLNKDEWRTVLEILANPPPMPAWLENALNKDE